MKTVLYSARFIRREKEDEMDKFVVGFIIGAGLMFFMLWLTDKKEI